MRIRVNRRVAALLALCAAGMAVLSMLHVHPSQDGMALSPDPEPVSSAAIVCVACLVSHHPGQSPEDPVAILPRATRAIAFTIEPPDLTLSASHLPWSCRAPPLRHANFS